MRSGHTEKANALAIRIGSEIVSFNSGRLKREATDFNPKDLWSAVRDITGKRRTTPTFTCCDAAGLNAHYCNVSTDPAYKDPDLKHTCLPQSSWPSDFAVFGALNNLRPSAAGPDLLPSWFLKLGAPLFAAPVAHLFNLSLNQSSVPNQWKTAAITPIPKIPLPLSCSDFRPISLTPILCRVMEKLLLKSYIYPALSNRSYPIYSNISDQFAFRPTGSTTAALISLLQTVSEMLESHPFVHVISCDFSKAFDSVRHHTLMQKVAAIPIPDSVFNWMVDFFTGRTHFTKFQSQTSSLAPINAGVVQGSAIGPASFIICASDLHPITPGNKCKKYADDMYLIVPSKNSLSIPSELNHISSWASNNNLRLNPSKSTEIIFKKPRSRCPDPPPTPDIARVTSLKVLGITLQSNLSMTEHTNNLMSKAGQVMYALKVLKSNGLAIRHLNTICNATLVNSLTYASPSWWGYTNTDDQSRLQSALNKAYRWGLSSPPSPPNLVSLCDKADSMLFSRICSFSNHVLKCILPPLRHSHYNVRARSHNFSLPLNSPLLQRNFLHRMLFKDSY